MAFTTTQAFDVLSFNAYYIWFCKTIFFFLEKKIVNS